MAVPSDQSSGLTLDMVEHLFQVDAEGGLIWWKNPTNPRLKVGSIAGCQTHRSAYVMIGLTIQGKKKWFKRHRLIWLYVHGKWPEADIDHINGVPGDDRISNLRAATKSQNSMNCKVSSKNTSGCKGVCWNPKKERWRARITMAGKENFLGWFKTLEGAIVARKNAEIQYFGEFVRREQNEHLRPM